MTSLLTGLTVGWILGFLSCWVYFVHNKLIRSREEWLKAINGNNK